MANIKSQKKRILTNAKRTERNKAIKSELKTRAKTATRDAVAQEMYALGAVILGCGVRSLRLRPPLDVTTAELDEGLELMRRAVDRAALKSA